MWNFFIQANMQQLFPRLLNTTALVTSFFVFMGLSACKPELVSPAGFDHYIGDVDNGLVQKANSGVFDYEVHYLPPEVMAIREIGVNAAKDSTRFAQTLHDFDGFFHFKVMMTAKGGASIKDVFKTLTGSEDKQKSMQHLAFGLQSGLYCLLGRDSLPSAFYHYQPTEGVDNRWQFAVSVPRPEGQNSNLFEEDLIFNFQDSILAKKSVSFVFSKNDLNKIPKINFQL